MVSVKVACKSIALAVIFSAVALAEGIAADLERKIRSAESCLSDVTKLRGSRSFTEMNLGGFARKLANDINYAETWRPIDRERAEAIVGSQTCEDRLANWDGVQKPTRNLYARAAGSDGTEFGEAPALRMSDLEYYLLARQKAIETVARMQARPYVPAAYRRP